VKIVECPCGSGKDYKDCCYKKTHYAKHEKKKRASIIVTVALVFVVLISVLVPSFIIIQKKGRESLAECLAEKGFVLYGSEWCGKCEEQLELFRAAANKLKYVDCTTSQPMVLSYLCIKEQINQVPTWKAPDGRMLKGYTSARQLSAESGCPYFGI